MKKEVFLAVFVGFALGLIITFGIWTANRTLHSQAPAASPTPVTQAQPSPTPAPSQIPLTLTSPDDESISTTTSASVSGKTSPNSPVIISDENSQTVIISDSSGTFTSNIKLEGGYNRISVSVFDASGNSVTKNILVTYTTSKI